MTTGNTWGIPTVNKNFEWGNKMLLRVFIKGQETIKTIWSTQQEILLVKVDSAEVP